MINPKKILIIIQRSNGDVFLSLSLINQLYEHYDSIKIDLLVNDDTVALARLLPNINYIHTFSYFEKKKNSLKQEKNLILSLFRKYDLSINLTASDRSVIYALIASKISISAIEKVTHKSWWKRKFLTSYYYFDTSRHILLNNLESLNILNIKHEKLQKSLDISKIDIEKTRARLDSMGIDKFFIFHPSSQYNYKIYPKKLRNRLLEHLNTLGVSIIITGSNSEIDLEIKKEIPVLSNVHNLIGKTSLNEYFTISHLSMAYIGMDTLNMHIATSQNKRVFAIYGPTNLKMWAPWSNDLKVAATKNMKLQNYGKITIFQSSLPCVACGNAGCDNSKRSECLYTINPDDVFLNIKKWFEKC